MTGRRAVDHDEVVGTRSLELLDLAEHHDVVDPGRGRADHVDHAGSIQSFGDPGEPVVAEVLVEGVGCGNRHHLEVGDQFRQGRLAVEFDDQHTQTLPRCGAGDDSRYRGLPHTPLARHHDDSSGGQRLQRIFALRRHLCAD